jgi:hypothetical protein
MVANKYIPYRRAFMKRFVLIVLLVGFCFLVSCEGSESIESEEFPTMEEVIPLFVFAEDDGKLIGVASELDFRIESDSLIYLGEKLIGVYQEEDE